MSHLRELEQRLGARWVALHEARSKTEEILSRLRSALHDLDDPHASVIVTGSLGRREACGESDADWFLLVDGPSNPDHASLAVSVQERIESVIRKRPGPTGTFGDIVASHGLVHYIAGTRDSNENLTRRVLLLSESRALTNPLLRERVIRNLLARYVVHDRAVKSRSGRYNRIPNFLLNDVVRYWRTIAADYASKMWERRGAGWGIRNVKLRFSRKLLFVWGLLASFSGTLFGESLEAASDEDEFLRLLAELIREQTDVTPLDLLARVCLGGGVKDATALSVFSAYDEFIGALSDPATRRRLEEVRVDTAPEDATYERLRQTSHRFRAGINAIFFEEHPVLAENIRLHGVF